MNHANNSRRTEGFTIIELTLAMAFIAALLLAIAMTVIQIGAMYGRGMMLKETNQTARVIIDDIRRTITGGAAFSDTEDYVVFDNVGGRICTGTYSYVWNVGAAQSTNGNNVAHYEGDATVIRLVKIADGSKSYCQRNAAGNVAKRDIPASERSLARELINAGDRDLALHQLRINTSQSAEDTLTGQRLYSMNFIIGTNDQAALQTDTTTGEKVACLAPGQPNADPLYCSVREFTLVVRTGNRG